MKQILFLISALIVSIAALTAQTSDNYTGALLWKISGNGLDKPSYIVGTHHLASTSFIDSIPGLRKAMSDVEQVAGEILMNDMVTMQVKMQQAGMMPVEETYDSLLTVDEYARLDEGLKRVIGIGLDQLGGFKPGMLSAIYSISIYAQLTPNFNPAAHEAIDQYIQKYAADKGKSVIGLETMEDQIRALYDAEPLKIQAVNFACAVGYPDFAKESLINLNKYYAEKNLAKMHDLAFNDPNDPCPASELAQLALNKDRNDKWITKLPAIMKDKSTLVAVGALHLSGKEGLLNQLAKLGYTVEAVK